jgi:hypothetical protein
MLTEREMKCGPARLAVGDGGADGGYDPSCRFLDNAGVDAKLGFGRGSTLPRENWT